MLWYSQTVDHGKLYDETVFFHKVHSATHILPVVGEDLRRLSFTNEYITHLLLVIGKKSEDAAIHKMCNVTHPLLVVGKGVMILPFTKCAMLHTSCWSLEKM